MYFEAHRTELILACVGGVFGNAIAVIVFAGWLHLLRAPELARGLGRIGFAAMLLQLAVVSVGFSILAAAAYSRPGADTTTLLSDVAWTVVNLGGGPATVVAVLAFTAALRRADLSRSRWMWPLAVITAFSHVVVSVAFADGGFMAPQGAVSVTVPIVYFAWIAGVSVELLSARSRLGRAAPA